MPPSRRHRSHRSEGAAMTETTYDIVEPLIEAYTAENVLRFYEIGRCDNTGWKRVFRRLPKSPTPSPDMPRAFEHLWLEHTSMALAVAEHRRRLRPDTADS